MPASGCGPAAARRGQRRTHTGGAGAAQQPGRHRAPGSATGPSHPQRRPTASPTAPRWGRAPAASRTAASRQERDWEKLAARPDASWAGRLPGRRAAAAAAPAPNGGGGGGGGESGWPVPHGFGRASRDPWLTARLAIVSLLGETRCAAAGCKPQGLQCWGCAAVACGVGGRPQAAGRALESVCCLLLPAHCLRLAAFGLPDTQIAPPKEHADRRLDLQGLSRADQPQGTVGALAAAWKSRQLAPDDPTHRSCDVEVRCRRPG